MTPSNIKQIQDPGMSRATKNATVRWRFVNKIRYRRIQTRKRKDQPSPKDLTWYCSNSCRSMEMEPGLQFLLKV